jgi:hypothetical protein
VQCITSLLLFSSTSQSIRVYAHPKLCLLGVNYIEIKQNTMITTNCRMSYRAVPL